jgi:hypothetical protein
MSGAVGGGQTDRMREGRREVRVCFRERMGGGGGRQRKSEEQGRVSARSTPRVVAHARMPLTSCAAPACLVRLSSMCSVLSPPSPALLPTSSPAPPPTPPPAQIKAALWPLPAGARVGVDRPHVAGPIAVLLPFAARPFSSPSFAALRVLRLWLHRWRGMSE